MDLARLSAILMIQTVGTIFLTVNDQNTPICTRGL
jgi:hypothetical protein